MFVVLYSPPPAREDTHNHHTHDRRDKPTVIARVRPASQSHSAGFQGTRRLHLRWHRVRINRWRRSSTQEFVEINQRPDEKGQEDRLVHRRGLHVEQVWIECVDRCGEVGDKGGRASSHQAKYAERAHDIRHHAGDGSRDPAAPERVNQHNGSMATCWRGSQTVPSCPYDSRGWRLSTTRRAMLMCATASP